MSPSSTAVVAVAEPAASTELDVLEERREAFQLLRDALAGTVDLGETWDTDQVQRAIALQILAAETDEEAELDANLRPWSELLGRPVEAQAVHFNRSSMEGGPGFYSVVKLVDLETGEVSVRHVGGFRPTAQLLRRWAKGGLPWRCRLVEVAEATKGRSAPLGIKSLDDSSAKPPRS